MASLAATKWRGSKTDIALYPFSRASFLARVSGLPFQKIYILYLHVEGRGGVIVDTLYEGCNQKIVLSEDLVETRRFPPVSLKDSNTQNIENLLKEEDFARHLEIKSRLISGEIDSATALDLIKD